jgi:hypothetical protein
MYEWTGQDRLADRSRALLAHRVKPRLTTESRTRIYRMTTGYSEQGASGNLSANKFADPCGSGGVMMYRTRAFTPTYISYQAFC